MSIALTCPGCRQSFDLREARTDDEWREFVVLMASLPQAVQMPLLRYLELFKPARQATVRSSVLLRLAEELAPMITDQRIKRRQAIHEVPHSRWAGAMTHLYNTQDKLNLPLKGNGYLLETIVNAIERQEAAAERKRDEQLRNQPVAPVNTASTNTAVLEQPATTVTRKPTEEKSNRQTSQQRARSAREILNTYFMRAQTEGDSSAQPNP